MADLAYQITRYGDGFGGRKRRLLGVVTFRLRQHLRPLHGPFTINEKGEYDKNGVVNEVARRFKEHPNAEFKMVVAGSRYDEKAWAVRSIAKLDVESPLITWSKQWLGRSNYVLGAPGPPGPSDCSGLTMNAVSAVFHEELPHNADLQLQDSRIEHFHDPGELASGSFVFLNYGRLAWPHADHVEFWVKSGQTLGSRPSTDGVSYYRFTSYDVSRVVSYGRWKG